MSWLLPKHLEILVLDKNLHLVEKTEKAIRFVDSPADIALGIDIRDTFPELFGIETLLEEIANGERADFDIKGIGRTTVNETLRYLDIYIIRHPDYALNQGQKAFILFLEEVTERMRLEQTLVQATNETHLLLNTLALAKENIDKIIASMAEVLLIISEVGVINRVNQAAQNLLGYTEAELINHPLAFIAIENQEKLDAFINRTDAAEWEVLCQKKNGEKIVISFSRSVIKTEVKGSSGQQDVLQEFVYIGRDVTEQKRKQKRLEAQHAASQILSESTTVENTLSEILRALSRILEWQIGELWMIDEMDTSTMYCTGVWVAPPLRKDISRSSVGEVCLTFTPGITLAQWVCTDRQPVWLNDLTQHPTFSTLPAIKAMHTQTALGFPIQTDKQILGVMTFFKQDRLQRDDELLQVVTTLGNQLGQYVQRKRVEDALQLEREKTERLLLNILPTPIAERLKQGACTIAEQFAEVSVLFADLVGFTEMASTLSPIELVELLNQIFSEFDELTEKHGLEKIKTIGDAYMVVAGLPAPNERHAFAIANMALDMQTVMVRFNKAHQKNLSIRIGIHSGTVVAGVIGLKKFIYDLWGDTVNTASRMESHGLADCIQVSNITYELLRTEYHFEQRGIIPIKGKGNMVTYFLVGRLPHAPRATQV